MTCDSRNRSGTDADAVKFVMDSGAAGVMFPFVANAHEASRCVQMMKYPPVGTRGVAQVIRATNYGRNWQGYQAEANEQSLVIVQIETQSGHSLARFGIR